jgi:hypothetical protein
VKGSVPLISEWASPNFHTVDGALFVLLLLLAVVGLSLSPRRPDPTDVIVTLAFVTLAAMAVRNLTLSSVVLGVTVARYLPGALRMATARWQGRAGREVGPAAAVVLNVTCLTVVASVFGILAAGDFPRSDSVSALARGYPVRTLEQLQGSDIRLFSQETWGGLALYLGWPRVRVALDGRMDMYGTRLVKEYVGVRAARPGWEDWMRRHCVTHILVDDKTGLAVALRTNPDWALAGEQKLKDKSKPGSDARAVLYVPRTPFPICEI